MNKELINWYQEKHTGFISENEPSSSSLEQLILLQTRILDPLSQLGTLSITYGFTNHKLLRFLLKHSPDDMGPNIDQHASMELNSKGNRICKRDGAACDLYVKGYEQRMDEIAKYICKHLEFDRLYFYGKDRPIHISVGPEDSRYALIREKRSDGLRVNKKSAKGSATQTLFDNL
ncbi:hypothetical protein [Vibrio japonicus]|uniref:Peptidase M15A C-terminal domain-containing protein n=1 Tax=Vibrio japonicus TaxID=1824638 RepID=A0ABY5LDY4_9VIBR|nr:hypothetical protein [Vibrio japonicus]UUM29681.1 hypothetical protein NP165_08115 [Vibrio japonicus]